MESHSASARRIGVTDAELWAIEQRLETGVPTETWEALRFAQAMTRDPHEVSAELVENLRARYGDAGIVELASVVGLCNYFNRFTSVFRIALSGSGQPYDEAAVRVSATDDV
jgi:alkylhydroperoxidase family enzyme